MSPELVILGLIFAGACGVFVTLFLRAFYHRKFTKALIFKGIASLCFVTFGLVNFLTSDFSPSTLLIFIGLCFGIVGDEVIALCQNFPKYDSHAFLGGGSSFLVGHLFYIAALLSLRRVNLLSMIIAFAIIASLCLLYNQKRHFLVGNMKISLSLYLSVLVFLASLAIGVFVERKTVGVGLFALGGVLFATSDNLLFAYKFGKEPRFLQNIALHATYYDTGEKGIGEHLANVYRAKQRGIPTLRACI